MKSQDGSGSDGSGGEIEGRRNLGRVYYATGLYENSTSVKW